MSEAASPAGAGREAKVLTVSDGVVAGHREDRSGPALEALLTGAGWQVRERRVVADGLAPVAEALVDMTEAFAGLVVTTGGTGFGTRDLTPEATASVLDRLAPGLAEAMRGANPAMGRLSRGTAGTRGRSIVLNVPGSSRGAVECLESVLDVLAHAVELNAGEASSPHPT